MICGVLFKPNSLIIDTKKELANVLDWKSDPSIQSPLNESNLKLLHFGKFLDSAQILNECGFKQGTTTIVHLLVKNEQPTQGTLNSIEKPKVEKQSCKCLIL